MTHVRIILLSVMYLCGIDINCSRLREVKIVPFAHRHVDIHPYSQTIMQVMEIQLIILIDAYKY